MSIAWNASTPEMDEAFSARNEVRTWIAFEVALANAEAKVGLIPAEAAEAIARHGDVDLFDLEKLRQDIAFAVHPIMPFVRMFSSIVGSPHGEYVHWGATTQDVTDTGFMLRIQQADRHIAADLDRLIDALRRRAREHRDTPMAGRTHAQHAVPITFGYKLAVWVDELERHRETLEGLRPRTLVGQFGGATGTLASIGPVGLQIRALMMEELGLAEPRITWHVARDRIAHHAFILTLIASAIARLGAEIVDLQRDEIGEVFEPFHHGKVGSSTMPHKRNPSMSESLMALGEIVKSESRISLTALGSRHERDKAIYSVETSYVPRVWSITHRMLRLCTTIVEGMEVDADRMVKNLELSRGQLFSERALMTLAGTLGRQTGHDVIYDASMRAFDSGQHLRDALASDPTIAERMSPAEIDALFDLGGITEVAGQLVDDVCGTD
jgi:adenylosuccinate lyase